VSHNAGQQAKAALTRAIDAPDLASDAGEHFIRDLADLERLGESVRALLNVVADVWRSDGHPDGRPLRSYSGARPADLRQTIRQHSADFFPAEGRSPAELRDQIADVVRHTIDLRHPWTAAHLHCPPLREAVAAEVLIALLNQSMDSYDQSGVATSIETELIAWLAREIFGANHTTGDGIFTSGGTQSNLMGLLLAREWAMAKHSGRRVFYDGLPADAGRYRILCQQHAHFSVVQSAALLGLGRAAVVSVRSDENGRMSPGDLADQAARIFTEGGQILAVCATAGTTDHGAIDDLAGLADFCERYDLWLHVDAAYGGALLFSNQRARLRGVERADSLAIDFHKLFFQPIACGAFLTRDASDLGEIRHHADYLNRADDVFPNLVDRSLATTRRFDALKLYYSLQGLGRTNFARMIDRLFELTARARDEIASNPALRLVCDPQLTTLLFQCVGEDGQVDPRLQSRVRDALLSDGTAVVGETRLQGAPVLKLTLMNPTTEFSEIQKLLQRIIQQSQDLATGIQPPARGSVTEYVS
jgi:diaminobutyrate-2-oxoglutarate transaminase